jgi:hypothetical protein
MGLDRDLNGVLDGDETSSSLAALRSGTCITSSWPTNSMGVVLEFTESLSPSSWRTETSAQSVEADRRMITVPMANQSRFYRLRGL